MNSENLQAEGEQKNSVFKVTPLSKYLAMALFIALPFIGGWVGYTFAPEKVVEVERNIEIEKVVTKDVVEEKQMESTEIDLSIEYQSSAYRVVSVVDNPYYPEESKYNSLIIAAPRGINDYTCGGMYVPPTCYLFLESSYFGIETPQFVGTWSGGFPVLTPKTVKFISPTVIEFNASNGDGGYGVKTVWHLDVTTGSSTLISQEESSADELH